MELLLFLSAILSALTGVISGGRVAETQVHQTCGVSVAAQVVAAQVRAAPLVRSYLALAGGWAMPVLAAPDGFRYGLASFPAVPRYLDKPRN